MYHRIPNDVSPYNQKKRPDFRASFSMKRFFRCIYIRIILIKNSNTLADSILFWTDLAKDGQRKTERWRDLGGPSPRHSAALESRPTPLGIWSQRGAMV